MKIKSRKSKTQIERGEEGGTVKERRKRSKWQAIIYINQTDWQLQHLRLAIVALEREIRGLTRAFLCCHLC